MITVLCQLMTIVLKLIHSFILLLIAVYKNECLSLNIGNA